MTADQIFIVSFIGILAFVCGITVTIASIRNQHKTIGGYQPTNDVDTSNPPRRFPGMENPPPPPPKPFVEEYRIKEFAGRFTIEGRLNTETEFERLNACYYPSDFIGRHSPYPLRSFDTLSEALDLVEKLKKGVIIYPC